MGVFCGDPFRLRPEEVRVLTSRQLWEWYLKPELDKSERLKEQRRHGDRPEVFEPQNEDEALAALDALKAFLPGSVGEIPKDLYRGI